MKGQNNFHGGFSSTYNNLEKLEFKLEKIIGIQKSAGKVRKEQIFHFEVSVA